MKTHLVRTVSAPDEIAGSVFVNESKTAELLNVYELLKKVAQAARDGDKVLIEWYNGEQRVVIARAPKVLKLSGNMTSIPIVNGECEVTTERLEPIHLDDGAYASPGIYDGEVIITANSHKLAEATDKVFLTPYAAKKLKEWLP